MSGVAFIILATLGWGLWGFFNKGAQGRIGAAQISFMVASTSIITAPIYMKLMNQSGGFVWDWFAMGLAFLSGLCAAVASLSYTSALSTMNVATVIGITSAYPLITLVLTMIFYQEPVTLKQFIGFILVILGVIILSV